MQNSTLSWPPLRLRSAGCCEEGVAAPEMGVLMGRRGEDDGSPSENAGKAQRRLLAEGQALDWSGTARVNHTKAVASRQ